MKRDVSFNDQTNKKDPSLLVHLNKEECKIFDFYQGGTKVIPIDDEFSIRMETLGYPIVDGQIRDYRPLAKVMKDPKVQKDFFNVLEKRQIEGKNSPGLKSYYEIGKEAVGKFENVPERDPALKKLAKEGEGGDTEIVYMPLSVCDFLDSLRGKPKTNSKTGFPEYFWGSLASIGLQAAGMYMAHSGHQKMNHGRQEEIASWERENKLARAEREQLRKRMGVYDAMHPLTEGLYPAQDQSYYQKLGEYPSQKEFKKGGLTKNQEKGHDLHNYVDVSEAYNGKGKGQQDNLKKDLPINGYIVSADAVSMLGDGNTNSGLALLKKIENRIKSNYQGKRINKKLTTIKGKTSDGEYQFSPLSVTLMGDGNNDKGSAKLDRAIAELRIEKKSNGPHLSPKAKPFESYFR